MCAGRLRRLQWGWHGVCGWSEITAQVHIESHIERAWRVLLLVVMLLGACGGWSWRDLIEEGDEHGGVHRQVEPLIVWRHV